MSVRREGAKYVSYVTMTNVGVDETTLVHRGQDVLTQAVITGALDVPDGYYFKWTGSYERNVRAKKRLAILVPLVLLINFVLIYLQFKRVSLAAVIFLAVWISLSILGVQNAFGLGVLSGLLEFLPVIGPFIGTAAAVLVAFFQPDNYLGLDPVYYALLVLGVMMLIQQIENNLLVPRIVGGALDLHALLVIIGVFMGATMAGLIGAILAAPILASTKLLGTYAWRKMFDLPPFPEPELSESVPRDPIRLRLKRWWNRKRKQEPEEVDPS